MPCFKSIKLWGKYTDDPTRGGRFTNITIRTQTHFRRVSERHARAKHEALTIDVVLNALLKSGFNPALLQGVYELQYEGIEFRKVPCRQIDLENERETYDGYPIIPEWPLVRVVITVTKIVSPKATPPEQRTLEEWEKVLSSVPPAYSVEYTGVFVYLEHLRRVNFLAKNW